MTWKVVFTKQAKQDAKKIARSGLKPQAAHLIGILRKDPYQTPPPYEKLLVPRNIISFVFTKSMIYWRQLNEGGCHVAKISSNPDEGGAWRA